MNTPPASAGGFSGKLCGIPLTFRLTGRSIREVGPLQHNAGRCYVPVEDAAAIAAVHPLRESLGLGRAAFRAGLRRAVWIDQPDNPTSVCSFVGSLLDESVPCSVVNGLGEHPSRKADDVQVLEGDVSKAIGQSQQELALGEVCA